jgi:hypothetical protein
MYFVLRVVSSVSTDPDKVEPNILFARRYKFSVVGFSQVASLPKDGSFVIYQVYQGPVYPNLEVKCHGLPTFLTKNAE